MPCCFNRSVVNIIVIVCVYAGKEQRKIQPVVVLPVLVLIEL